MCSIQMKGRGCRVIKEDKLKEVTPNAHTKECYYIVDAVGVTEHEKCIPKPGKTPDGTRKILSLENLLEHLAHNEVSDENMMLLRDCAQPSIEDMRMMHCLGIIWITLLHLMDLLKNNCK